MSQHILIIGQGILGSCLAYEVAQRLPQARITCVASHPIGSGATASGASWGWVNAHVDNDATYFQFRNASRLMWHDLIHQHPDLAAQRRPSLVFDLSDDALQDAYQTHHDWGYPIAMATRQDILRDLLSFRGAPECALLTQDEVGVETAIAADQLLALSQAKTVTAHVHGLISKGTQITGAMTSDGPILADHVILAAGHGTPALLQTVGVPFHLEQSRGLLVRTQSIDPFLTHMIMGPDFHVRQSGDGSLLIGGTFDQDFSGELSVADAALGLVNQVQDNFDIPNAQSDPLRVSSFSIGTRVLPPDGLPIIGRVDPFANLSVMAMHGGVTNAPMAARTCVDSLLGLDPNPTTAPYGFRPTSPEQGRPDV